MEREQRQQNVHGNRISVGDIAEIGVMSALIEVSKLFMQGIPNVELTSFWLIMFTLYFGKKVFYVIPVFVLLEGLIYGFGLWWIMYLYMWPSLALLARILKKIDSVMAYSILSSAYGFLFGFFCAIPYLFIGMADGGVKNGIYTAFTWWVAGIPYDMIHGVANFVLMFILYKPIRTIMNKMPKISESF